ncbi:MAG: hypothetical protein AB1352_04570, partial [Patescibacteria group bacterium]
IGIHWTGFIGIHWTGFIGRVERSEAQTGSSRRNAAPFGCHTFQGFCLSLPTGYRHHHCSSPFIGEDTKDIPPLKGGDERGGRIVKNASERRKRMLIESLRIFFSSD